MQKNKKNKLSNNKILEILNSGQTTYSANESHQITKSLIKLSQITNQYWNEKSKREKSNSVPKS